MAQLHNDYLLSLPDITLINRYQCIKCGDILNERCNICQKSIKILYARHENIFIYLSQRLHKEFGNQTGWEIRDYKVELQIRMTIYLRDRIKIQDYNEEYDANRQSYWYYMGVRAQLHQKYKTHKRDKKCTEEQYVDSLYFTRRVEKDDKKDLYLNSNILEISRKKLNTQEFTVFKYLLSNYKQSEIAKELGLTPGTISYIKNKIIKKLRPTLK